jgi:AcrR family transcriptional regulator
MTRSGRRPKVDDSSTRDQIRVAARQQFAERGYQATTIRSVAEQAAVDPSLVMHFFRSKDQLFEACVEWPFDPEVELAAVIDAGLPQAGEQLVRLFLATWDARGGHNPVVTLLRTAMSQESVGRLLREFIQVRLLTPLVEAFELDQPELRAGLVASQLLGLGIVRYGLRFDGLAELPHDAVVASIAPTIQRYLSGEL